MPGGKIECPNCHQQQWVPASARTLRCNNCQTTISVGTHENGRINNKSIPNGCLRKLIEASCSRSGSAASSLTKVEWPNPIDSTTSHQPRKALICGVSYIGQRYMLKGTINDVNQVMSLLIDEYKFPREAICVLTEESGHSHLPPTKANMEKGLRWLVSGNRSGDSLVFYFSGHGLRQPDFNDDELDGFDETLCPVDYLTEGMILDNDINTTIVKPLKPGVTLHAIIDACHSGTVLDLENLYDRKLKKWMDNRPPSGASKKTSGGWAVCLSACADNEFAADTNALSASGKDMAGAMTFIFIEAIRKHQRDITYGKLLDEMINQIEDVNKAGCFNSRFLRKVFRTRSIQKPLLSSSKEFNVDEKKFEL